MRGTALAVALMMSGAVHAHVHVGVVDSAVRTAMAKTGAKGMAVALIEQGKPVYVHAYGVRNAAGDALTTDTVMDAASLTKTVFAYWVMRLADAGKIKLDTPIAEILPQPLPIYGTVKGYGRWGDLAGDGRWRHITPRIALTHGTGFANFEFFEPDSKLHIHFDPGTHYGYSGEGIQLLQFAIERGLGIDVGAAIQAQVLAPLGMRRTAMVWRPDFAGNQTDGWTVDGQLVPHDERRQIQAAGSMDTTIADFARFTAALVRGQGLSAAARAEMVRPQLAITTARQFPSLQPDAPAGQRFPDLAAGLGVITFRGAQGPGFYKGGHNDATGNTMVCLEKGWRCIVILSDDVRSEAAFGDIVRAALGETGVPWKWEYGPDYSSPRG